MKIKKLSLTRKKKIIITILVLVAAVAAGGGVFAYQHYQNSDSGAKNEEAKQTEKASKPDSAAKESDSEAYPENEKSTFYSDPQAETSVNEASGKTIVSVVSSVDISDGVVYIRGGVNNVVDTAGTCYALLKGPSGVTIQKNTVLLQGSSTTDCKTIQIPVSELSPGRWTYTLNYSSTTAEGASSENSFQIN